MTYDMNKLGQMTLDELKDLAKTFGLKVGRNVTNQDLIYDILDVQAVRHAEEVEAKAEAREGERKKRERTRVSQKQDKVEKVGLSHLKNKGPKMTSQEEEQKAITAQKEQRAEEQARMKERKEKKKQQTSYYTSAAQEIELFAPLEEDINLKVETAENAKPAKHSKKAGKEAVAVIAEATQPIAEPIMNNPETEEPELSEVDKNAAALKAKREEATRAAMEMVTTSNSTHAVLPANGVGAASGNVQVYSVASAGEVISESSVWNRLTGSDNGLTLTPVSPAPTLAPAVPQPDGTAYVVGTNGALRFTPTAAGKYAYVLCETQYVAPTYEPAGATFDLMATYYFRSATGVYYAASGLHVDNYDTYRSMLYLQTSPGVPGVYTVKVLTVVP